MHHFTAFVRRNRPAVAAVVARVVAAMSVAPVVPSVVPVLSVVLAEMLAVVSMSIAVATAGVVAMAPVVSRLFVAVVYHDRRATEEQFTGQQEVGGGDPTDVAGDGVLDVLGLRRGCGDECCADDCCQRGGAAGDPFPGGVARVPIPIDADHVGPPSSLSRRPVAGPRPSVASDGAFAVVFAAEADTARNTGEKGLRFGPASSRTAF
jgi:hypothetical protein